MLIRSLLLLCLVASLEGSRLRTLYNGLDLKSVPQHLTFYSLYPESEEGQESLAHAWRLLGAEEVMDLNPDLIPLIVDLIAFGTPDRCPVLGESQLQLLHTLGDKLPHRTLKGHHVGTQVEVIALPDEEIDLARGMLLSQLGEEQMDRIRSVEALLDLIALQILARMEGASDEEKVDLLNRFIFEEMRFRFPPHSEYSDEIDAYTFLPSVLDSRVGVCLGVSSLYLCLGQRLGLDLEVITPPGHIFIRHQDRNIETTARGIRLSDEEYLGLNTRSLQVRTIKEVIGLTHINEASVHWRKKEYEKAIASYERAAPYLPKDKLLKELWGLNLVLAERKDEGRLMLTEVAGWIPDDAVVGRSTVADYLAGHADREALELIFEESKPHHEALLERKNALTTMLQRCPRFRSGWLQLATTWLQLHRQKEALVALERYHQLERGDPTVEYYLAILYANRLQPKKAWMHLAAAEKIVQDRNHKPLALKEMRKSLSRAHPVY